MTFLIWEIWKWKWHRVRPIKPVPFKIWPQVRRRSGHGPSRSRRISPEAAWRAKSFGTIYASLSPSCRELLAEKRIATSCELKWPSCEPQSSVAPGSSQMGWVSWLWKNWVVSVSSCETGSFCKFPNRKVTILTWHWVARIKTPGRTFYSLYFDLMQSCKLHSDPTWTVAMAWLQAFLKEGQLTWLDLVPKISQNVGNERPTKVRKL